MLPLSPVQYYTQCTVHTLAKIAVWLQAFVRSQDLITAHVHPCDPGGQVTKTVAGSITSPEYFQDVPEVGHMVARHMDHMAVCHMMECLKMLREARDMGFMVCHDATSHGAA